MFDSQTPIKLSALDDDVVFSFLPIHADSVTYFFQMQNLDNQWFSSKFPETRYTNFKGKKYVFLMKAVVNGKETGITKQAIEKELSLTEEYWFLPSVVFYILLLFSAGLYFFMLNNFRQKLKVQTIRNRIASDLHDEVGATLSSIAISAKLVQKKLGKNSPEIQPILDRIKADSEETIHSIRDTVWTINPDNDSPEKLFEKIRSFAFELFAAMDIALQFENEILPDKKLKISMEQRRNIYLICKEAINNIAKHSAATKVKINISRHADGLNILIKDNGVGFDKNENYEGNGLKNFRSRAAESFIELKIQSEIGQGTEIFMLVPEL